MTQKVSLYIDMGVGHGTLGDRQVPNVHSIVDFLKHNERILHYISSLREYFDARLVESGTNGGYQLNDPALGSVSSCCTQAQAAGLYALDGVVNESDGLQISTQLLQNVLERQEPDGGFSIPYNRGFDEKKLSDIAELGAAADSIYLSFLCSKDGPSAEILSKAGIYTLKNVSAEQPGAIYKNRNTKSGDVLNGDIYGALAAARAYEVTRDLSYIDLVRKVVEHVESRFVRSSTGGWWPYMENWDGNVRVGNSVAYQATIISFGKNLSPYLDMDMAAKWNSTLDAALSTVIFEMGHGPTEYNEATAWARDWEHVWEIYLALAGASESPRAGFYIENRMERLDLSLRTLAAKAWTPAAQNGTAGSVVSSQFRKCSSFSGALATVCLRKS